MNSPTTSDPSQPMDRRVAIKWMIAAGSAAALMERGLFGATAARPAKGYGSDPDLLKIYKPGDLWPLTLTSTQRATAAALCDVIIPADAKGPSASSVRVHDFIDEWISAPYPGHGEDKTVIVEGLAWLDAEARKRFQNDFVNLVARQKTAICDDICYEPAAKADFKKAAQFFQIENQINAALDLQLAAALPLIK